jgi:hypothetical protein
MTSTDEIDKTYPLSMQDVVTTLFETQCAIDENNYFTEQEIESDVDHYFNVTSFVSHTQQERMLNKKGQVNFNVVWNRFIDSNKYIHECLKLLDEEGKSEIYFPLEKEVESVAIPTGPKDFKEELRLFLREAETIPVFSGTYRQVDSIKESDGLDYF